MIVEKTYICDQIPAGYTLRDYQRKIITQIVQDCNFVSSQMNGVTYRIHNNVIHADSPLVVG